MIVMVNQIYSILIADIWLVCRTLLESQTPSYSYIILTSAAMNQITRPPNKQSHSLRSIGGRQQDGWASTPFRITKIVCIPALAPITKIRKSSRGTQSPVRHALSLVTAAQIAAFAPIARRISHLLLAPNNMVLIVIPRAGVGVAHRIALLITELKGDEYPYDYAQPTVVIGAG